MGVKNGVVVLTWRRSAALGGVLRCLSLSLSSVSFVFQAAYVTLYLFLFYCLVPGCSGTMRTCPRYVWGVSERAPEAGRTCVCHHPAGASAILTGLQLAACWAATVLGSVIILIGTWLQVLGLARRCPPSLLSAVG